MRPLLVATLAFLTLGPAASAAPPCSTQDVIQKIHYCTDLNDQLTCTPMQMTDTADFETQLGLAFTHALPQMQSWFCNLTEIQVAHQGVQGVSVSVTDPDANLYYLVFNEQLLHSKPDIGFNLFYEFRFWSTAAAQAGITASFAAGQFNQTTLAQIDPGFQVLPSPAEPWTFLLYTSAHEFGHYLANMPQSGALLHFPCDQDSCNYDGSYAAISFADPATWILGPPTLLNSSESVLQQQVISQPSDLPKVEDQLQLLIQSDFMTAFGPQDPQEDFCETTAYYVSMKAGITLSVQLSDGTQLDMLDRVRNPQGAIQQKLDFLQRAL